MLMRNTSTGDFEVFEVSYNNITNIALLGTVGLDWKVGGFGDFNADGRTDMMLQNIHTGGLEAYNISHDAIIGAAYMGVTGLDWKIAGFGDFFNHGHDDMMMRNVNNGSIYTYDISGNHINSATYMGIVGAECEPVIVLDNRDVMHFGLLVHCRMILRTIARPGNHRHKDAAKCWNHQQAAKW
jgi:hypothetical protein